MGATTLEGAMERLSTPLVEEPNQPTETEVEPQEVAKTEEVSTEAETPSETVSDTQTEVERYKVKVGGEEREVTIDEMRSGYMMEADYRQKSTAVAEQRKALEAKQADIDTKLGEAQSLLSVEIDNLASAEMLELKETDPEAYVKEMDRVQGKAAKFNALQQKRNEEKQQSMKDMATKERELLQQSVPEWLDTEVMAKEAQEVMKRWSDQGYSKDEISQVVDHRRFVESRKAMLYDQLMSQDLSGNEVKVPPKSQKPAVSQPRTGNEQKAKDMRGRLRKSGSMQDAVNLFKSLQE